MTRFDWELSEILQDELVRKLGLDSNKISSKMSNYITETCDEIVSAVMEHLSELELSDDFRKVLEGYNEKIK